MRSLRTMLGLLALIVLAQPARTEAGFQADPVSNYDSTPVNLGGGTTSLATSTFYSNVTTFSGEATENGGAGAVSNLGTVTNVIADDITVGSGGAGGAVTSLQFSAANFNTTSVTTLAILYFYTGSPTSGPGTLFYAIDFTITSPTANSVGTYTYNPGTTIFTVPPSGQFWVGESFSNLGTSTTTAQLNKLGVGLFNPPTVGSSTDEIFVSSNASQNDVSNPAGTIGNFNGSPVANLGFAFSGTPTAVPEPSSLILTSLAGVILTVVGSRKAARSRILKSR